MNDDRKSPRNPRDAAHWDAVEEAAELLVEDKIPEAMIALRAVIMKDPNNPYAYHHLATAFSELGQREAARDAYQAAVRVQPDFLGARVALSHTLRGLGDHDGALAQAREALRRFPRDPEAMHAAGLAHAAKGNRPAAREQLQGFLAQGPEFEAAQEVRQILEMLGLGDDDEPIEFD
jgi:tetratricopeptide (TPR) repeat protein